MTELDLLGYAASGLTTASFVPQVWKTWRTRSTEDISHSWLAMFGLGISLWVVYGIWLTAWPIIVGNLVTLSLVMVIAWVKLSPASSIKEIA